MEIFGQRSETRLDKELGEWDIFAQEVLLMSNALWAPVIIKQNYPYSLKHKLASSKLRWKVAIRNYDLLTHVLTGVKC